MKAFRIEQDINNKMEQIVSLRELATKASNVLSDMPGSHNRNIHKTEDIIGKFIGMEEKLKKEINSLLGTKKYVKDLINQVTDREGRIILEQRYLQYDKKELPKRGQNKEKQKENVKEMLTFCDAKNTMKVYKGD